MPPESIRLLVVDDEGAFRKGICERLARKGIKTFGASTGEEAISIARRNMLDVALVDIRMPGMDGIELLAKLKDAHPSVEVIILTGVAAVSTAIEAMKLGAYDYLSKPCRFDELMILIEKAYEKKHLCEQNVLMKRELKRVTFSNEFIGFSEKAMEMRRFIQHAASTDSPVLLEGESGSGKEVIAREIHRNSPRASAPLVVLDCGVLPETLLADELFGHEKGAFTGAFDSRQGLLEIADGGTLLIDEIGEMTPANQVALLRVVETRTFRRLGGSEERSVTVAIIASTNRSLRDKIAKGNFREDLFYRLDVMRLAVPTLRERKDDIPLLADHFLENLNRSKGTNKRISAEQKELLKNHDWPGNVRELANVIERCFVLSSDNELDIRALYGFSPANKNRPLAGTASDGGTLSSIERDHILRMLSANSGNKKETAKALGISRSRLYNLLKKYSSEE